MRISDWSSDVCSSDLVKLAEARGAGLPETMFFRQACAVPLVLAWIAVRPGLASIRTQRIGAHLTRTIVGLMGMVCTFGAVLLLPLAEAMTLQFTVPIFATILSALVLREPTGRQIGRASCGERVCQYV